MFSLLLSFFSIKTIQLYSVIISKDHNLIFKSVIKTTMLMGEVEMKDEVKVTTTIVTQCTEDQEQNQPRQIIIPISSHGTHKTTAPSRIDDHGDR